jgi:hypothetical protein
MVWKFINLQQALHSTLGSHKLVLVLDHMQWDVMKTVDEWFKFIH